MGAAAFAVALLKLPASGAYKGTDKMDVIGSILYVISTGMILYGFSSLTTAVEAKYLLAAGTLIFVFFIYREAKIPYPVIKVRLFRSNPAYLFSNLAALLNYGATFALGYWLSIYLQMVKGMDSQSAGWVLVSQPLMMALLSPMAGRLSDRIAPYRLASLGMALCAAGLIPFAFATETMPMTLIVACLLTVGVGFALFSSPNVNAVMACVEPSDYGVASSILATMRSIGHSFSMAVVTLIVADRIGNIPLASADTSLITEAMRISFVVFTLLCFLGIYFSMRRRK
jgi:predicted MFS family arabinose efflux permease